MGGWCAFLVDGVFSDRELKGVGSDKAIGLGCASLLGLRWWHYLLEYGTCGCRILCLAGWVLVWLSSLLQRQQCLICSVLRQKVVTCSLVLQVFALEVRPASQKTLWISAKTYRCLWVYGDSSSGFKCLLCYRMALSLWKAKNRMLRLSLKHTQPIGSWFE